MSLLRADSMTEVLVELQALALAPGETAPWQELPPELLARILVRLPTNEVPCTARLVCKAAAAALSSPAHTTVRLSQPSPHSEFVCSWGAPGAMRPLTVNRRHRLLALTAASGCLHNLTWLAEHAGCSLDSSVLAAAAAAGRLETCRWLLQQGCEGLPAALSAAAGAGQRSTLEALLADRAAQARPIRLASCAARGGHVGLMDWLLGRFGLSSATHKMAGHKAAELLTDAATGCDLATLQRLQRTQRLKLSRHLEKPGGLGHLLSRAASSPTPDWKAKVEWVEVCLGRPVNDHTICAKAAACPDALERLTWLRARGYPWDWQAVTFAARAGNAEALSYLLAEGCEVQFSAIHAAGAEGHLAALEVLHSHSLAATHPGRWARWASAAAVAARWGQLLAVRWMLEGQLIELQQRPAAGNFNSLLGAAAECGSVELLALLRAGGCPWSEDDFCEAVRGGSEEALEWAVAQGCPVQESGNAYRDPYLIAAGRRDWSTLACLRRLAVPWQPLNRRGGTFAEAMRRGFSVPILRRFLDLGCPVDWRQALKEAEALHHYGHRDKSVWPWLQEEEQRRSKMGGAP